MQMLGGILSEGEVIGESLKKDLKVNGVLII